MADISAIPQNQLLGRLAGFLRFLEKDRPEFLPSELGAMQAASKLMLPQASTVENLSYGNLPFTMPPSGTGAMIPQVKTGRKAEVADLVGMITGVPGGRAVADVGTKLSNEAADALVRMITRNQQATAPAVLQETAMPFMNAIAPRQPGLLSPQKSELGFYSALEQATMPLQNKGTGTQFLAQIEKTPGVKPEELKWTGLDEFLRSRQNVTKAEVQDYLNANRVNLQEVRLGEPEVYDATRLSQLEKEFNSLKQHPIDDPSFGQEKYDELIRLMNIRDRSTTTNLYNLQESAMRAGQRAQSKGMPKAAERYFREAELYGVRAEKLDLEGQGMLAPSKFEQYVLPGGENYREILLTLPFKEPSMPKGYEVRTVQYDDGSVRYFADTPTTSSAGYKTEVEAQKELERMARSLKDWRASQASFRSSHFDQPNILAHMRVNDRVIDGKKTLFIEEIQSDWHQAGRKKGYQREKDLTPDQIDLRFIQSEVPPGADPSVYPGYYEAFDKKTGQFLGRHSGTLNREQAMRDAVMSANQFQTGVPNAPFKTSWHELTLKRAIQEASEKGYDQIAFTTGKTQAERYDLSKQIDEINVVGRTNAATGERTKSVALDTVNGQSIRLGVAADGTVDNVNDPNMSNLIGKNLDEVVGKELAEKIMEGGSQTISGEGLKVGGQGMKGFYDQILPKSLEKLGKKFDAKVGKTEMDGVEVWQMDITPKMRESVLTKGQPLFAATPVLPAGLLGRDEEE